MSAQSSHQRPGQNGHSITVFDVGMFDAEDTRYYLEEGFRVVAVEANPHFVQKANDRFRNEIASGQFTPIHSAISPTGEDVELTLSGMDLGSSSLFSDRIAHRQPVGAIRVPGVTLVQLFERYGVPHYLKVDIEGADGLCVLSLTPETRPRFLSFEVGDDVDELIAHAEKVGFTHFKIMSQTWFRELANQDNFLDRAARRLMRGLGYQDPMRVKRAGRFFVSGASSGPVPWRSDGKWYSGVDARARLRAAADANRLHGWYDIHATTM